MTPKPKRLLDKLALVAIAVIFSPVIIASLLVYGVYATVLHLVIWATWCRTGSRVFVSCSRSPHRQSRFEAVLIPQLPTTAIIVNWSDRKWWPRYSLRTLAFRHFLGRFDHTPAVVIFRAFRRAQVFRFHQAYDKFKHGNPLPVEEQESALLRALGAAP